MVELVCQFCGNKYESKNSHNSYATVKRKYCSKKCAWAGQKRDRHWRDGTFSLRSQRNLDGY